MGGNEKGLSKGNKFRKYILGSVRMIFVTVGTHEQPFNRLIKAIDRMKAGNVFNDDVIIQTGYSTYEPKFCEWQKLYPYDKMLELVNQARIVITHGGPSSFIMPLQIGKIPIVVPRQKQYGEHVNDHQMEFCRAVEQRFGNIIVAEDDKRFKLAIVNYADFVSSKTNRIISNNSKFVKNFEKEINEMFKEIKL